MRRIGSALVVLALGALALGCDPGTSKAGSPPAPTPDAVAPTHLEGEALDTNGDGKPDTWRRVEPDGVVVEQKDTNGDGKPDETKRLEPLEEPPPGIEAMVDEAEKEKAQKR